MIMTVGTVAVLISAAITDVRRGRIPNILVIILILFQTVFLLISQAVLNKPLLSGSEIFHRILAAAVVFMFLYPFFKIGGLGAGDVKLLTVTVLSVTSPIYFLMAVFAIGAFVSVIKIIFKKPVNDRGQRIVHMALPILAGYCVVSLPLWH